MLENVTPVVLTSNEESNIGRCLERLGWAAKIVVVDSHSQDRTVEICRQFANVTLAQRTYDNYWGQRNFADRELVATDWILALDADYILTDAFTAELAALKPDDDVGAYEIPFDFIVKGRRMRASAYPPLTRLYRRQGATYVQDGHKELLLVPGRVGAMRSPIQHDDRKSLTRWVQSQAYYAPMEAEKAAAMNRSNWDIKYVLRSWIPISPLVIGLYLLFLRGGILDGRAGLYYCAQRMVVEALICLHYMDKAWFRSSR